MRLLLFLSVWVSACSSMTTLENKPVEIKEKEEDKIMFLVFRISNDSVTNKRSVSVVNKIETEGVFKENQNKFDDFANKLIIEIMEEGQVVKTINIDHPLYQKTEYTEGNEWKSKLAIVQEAEFYFRFQKKQKETVIKIYEDIHEQKRTEIFTLKL